MKNLLENADLLFTNGVSGVTGQYAVPPLSLSDAADLVRGEQLDWDVVKWLARLHRKASTDHFGPFELEQDNLSETGWGIVFHVKEDDDIKQAFTPLIEHRKKQVGDKRKVVTLYYKNEKDSRKWLANQHIGMGNIKATRVPYYLLLVGSPERIPFSFSQMLAVEYAVGRLHLDTPEQYRNYVENVIAYENDSQVTNAKEAVFFATRHGFDGPTQLSCDRLVKPLVNGVPARDDEDEVKPVAEVCGFRSRNLLAKDATREALTGILTPAADQRPPAFLFTASHGIFLRHDEASLDDRLEKQGALLCQDWPRVGEMQPKYYLAGSDLPQAARLNGMIAFMFACCSGGTPPYDRFTNPRAPRTLLSEKPFIASLPKHMLTHPNGGALACIGHVERAWHYSFTAPGSPQAQYELFRNAVGLILTGKPVGYAMKQFGRRYAALATQVGNLREDFDAEAVISDFDWVTTWMDRNDAESYIIIGDPAVQLSMDKLA